MRRGVRLGGVLCSWIRVRSSLIFGLSRSFRLRFGLRLRFWDALPEGQLDGGVPRRAPDGQLQSPLSYLGIVNVQGGEDDVSFRLGSDWEAGPL